MNEKKKTDPNDEHMKFLHIKQMEICTGQQQQ